MLLIPVLTGTSRSTSVLEQGRAEEGHVCGGSGAGTRMALALLPKDARGNVAVERGREGEREGGRKAGREEERERDEIGRRIHTYIHTYTV